MITLWKARLAVALLRSAGCDVAIETRLVRDTRTARDLVGKRLNTFESILDGMAAFARHKFKPGQRFILSVRAELRSVEVRLEDNCVEIHASDNEVPGNADLVEPAHECDREGPLVPVDGDYRETCSACGEAQEALPA
jgi:hypothetical protein